MPQIFLFGISLFHWLYGIYNWLFTIPRPNIIRKILHFFFLQILGDIYVGKSCRRIV